MSANDIRGLENLDRIPEEQGGDLYLINHAGERKATGSYYTPDLIVEHLVRTALNPKLEAAKKAHLDNFKELFKAVLDIKVCDPAMGSGHMLQACYSRIIAFLHQTLEEMFEKGNKMAKKFGN